MKSISITKKLLSDSKYVTEFTNQSTKDKVSIETYLPDVDIVQGYTWNEEQVPKEISTDILIALKKYSSSFVSRENDVRVPVQGPMMQLMPSSYWGFTYKNVKVSVEFFAFSDSDLVVQAVIELEKKLYFSSTDIELIWEVAKFDALRPIADYQSGNRTNTRSN